MNAAYTLSVDRGGNSVSLARMQVDETDKRATIDQCTFAPAKSISVSCRRFLIWLVEMVPKRGENFAFVLLGASPRESKRPRKRIRRPRSEAMSDRPQSGKHQSSGMHHLADSEHPLAAGAKSLGPLDPNETVKLTVIVRRRRGCAGPVWHEALSRHPDVSSRTRHPCAVSDRYGAAQSDLDSVADFARAHGLQVVSTHRGRRSVELRGTAAQANEAFGVTLHWHQSRRGKYRSFEGPVGIPAALANVVEAVIGLDNRPVNATRPSAARRRRMGRRPATRGNSTPRDIVRSGRSSPHLAALAASGRPALRFPPG